MTIGDFEAFKEHSDQQEAQIDRPRLVRDRPFSDIWAAVLYLGQTPSVPLTLINSTPKITPDFQLMKEKKGTRS